MSKKEMLDTFTKQLEFIDVRSRDEVHRLGLWHQTFHCWLLQQEMGKNYILFQKRYAYKKDYPGFLDITAAGHLEAGEKPLDGIRELHEELGIELEVEELISVGIIPCLLSTETIIDNEFGHVYLVDYSKRTEPFQLQSDEVESIIRVEFEKFRSLRQGYSEVIVGSDLTTGIAGQEVRLTWADFLPHSESYYESVEREFEQFFNAKQKLTHEK
ncbi:NUDIX domain-containing protein [Paenibacillus sp. N1-5-1-14]|uniref:NUDIX hydrolase n=1 Tax=Paenibacillus radicibacter TaxID=2972488 RepID=UPI002158FB29|nr:NUDIX domain-containing protein [Paenibacillus radicibacter]MCR8642394.1 NUDIX domain-containing protein [Paenibacillus radicibacter]